MRKRPTSITVIAWILIVTSGLSVITCTIGLNNPKVKELRERSPLPISVQYVRMYVSLLIALISGIAMLKGHNWARFLFIICGAIGHIINFMTSPIKKILIPGFIVLLIVAFFLFRPKANEYFAGTEA